MSSYRHHQGSGTAQPRKQRRKDLRMWVAVVLMLAAIVLYVLTLDDSLASMVARTSFC